MYEHRAISSLPWEKVARTKAVRRLAKIVRNPCRCCVEMCDRRSVLERANVTQGLTEPKTKGGKGLVLFQDGLGCDDRLLLSSVLS